MQSFYLQESISKQLLFKKRFKYVLCHIKHACMQSSRQTAAALLSKFDWSLSGLGSVTLRRPAVPGGHIYLAHMHITQASVSLLHLLEGPWLRG